jgi:simple sugar transport system ATP-binding protein
VRGAGVLLISDDLDELMEWCDIIHVLSRGKLSAPLAAAAADPKVLGLMMSGAHAPRVSG